MRLTLNKTLAERRTSGVFIPPEQRVLTLLSADADTATYEVDPSIIVASSAYGVTLDIPDIHISSVGKENITVNA